MPYTNRLNSNPIRFTADIEIRSGTSSTASAIATEYSGTLGYEPGVGTLYISTSGVLFIHDSAGATQYNWSAVTETGPSVSPSISQSLSPSISPSLSTSPSLSPSLSPSISPSISPSPSA